MPAMHQEHFNISYISSDPDSLDLGSGFLDCSPRLKFRSGFQIVSGVVPKNAGCHSKYGSKHCCLPLLYSNFL